MIEYSPKVIYIIIYIIIHEHGTQSKRKINFNSFVKLFTISVFYARLDPTDLYARLKKIYP